MNIKTDEELFMNEMEEMLNSRVSTPLGFEDLESEDDIVTFCLTTLSIALTNMASVFSLSNLAKWEIDHDELLIEVKNLACSMSKLAETIGYELPGEEQLKQYQVGMPVGLSVSPFLAVMNMLGSVADLSYEIQIEFEGGAIWAEEAMPEPIQTAFCSLVSGLQVICKRYGISVKDIQS